MLALSVEDSHVEGLPIVPQGTSVHVLHLFGE